VASNDETSGLDLSGAWHGIFSYPPDRGQEPVSFTANITELGGWLDGLTHETGQVGEAAGKTISASLRGRRSERSVSFVKFYGGSYRRYDSVCYEGQVSGDGLEIDGRWTVPGSWSGSFLMIRHDKVTTPLAEKATQKV
jgi:hypothetical protein